MKGLLLDNLATKAMALFLAVITWVYLFGQGLDTKTIFVEFVAPEFDPKVFAEVRFFNPQGTEIEPGDLIRVDIRGTKEDIQPHVNRVRGTYKCQPAVKPESLTAEEPAELPYELKRQDFTVPLEEEISVSLSDSEDNQITVRYVKYRQKQLVLKPPARAYTGRPGRDYMVESVTPIPGTMEAWVPADLYADVNEVEFEPVVVDNKVETFTVVGRLGPKATATRIRPVNDEQPFQVEVKLALQTVSETISALPLRINVSPEHQDRVRIVDPKVVTIQIQGPKALVQRAKDLPVATFQPYLIVTDADVAQVGEKRIGGDQLRCNILDPLLDGKIKVVVMSDFEAANRQVKVEVMPRAAGSP